MIRSQGFKGSRGRVKYLITQVSHPYTALRFNNHGVRSEHEPCNANPKYWGTWQLGISYCLEGNDVTIDKMKSDSPQQRAPIPLSPDKPWRVYTANNVIWQLVILRSSMLLDPLTPLLQLNWRRTFSIIFLDSAVLWYFKRGTAGLGGYPPTGSLPACKYAAVRHNLQQVFGLPECGKEMG
jgi:hypothetical protein